MDFDNILVSNIFNDNVIEKEEEIEDRQTI